MDREVIHQEDGDNLLLTIRRAPQVSRGPLRSYRIGRLQASVALKILSRWKKRRPDLLISAIASPELNLGAVLMYCVRICVETLECDVIH
jgi:hypothetical protein